MSTDDRSKPTGKASPTLSIPPPTRPASAPPREAQPLRQAPPQSLRQAPPQPPRQAQPQIPRQPLQPPRQAVRAVPAGGADRARARAVPLDEEAPLQSADDDPLSAQGAAFPDLELEDTVALRKRGLAVAPNPSSGYNPYDTGAAADKRAARDAAAPGSKRTDLRKLSEWIRLQRQVEDLKKGDDEGK